MKTIYFIFVFFILSTFLAATIINVPGDQPTIQEGINVAVDSDTVLVQPDTYIENINYNGKNITVASLFLTTQDTIYISQTIIDGDSLDSVVIFESGEDSTAVLIGFTITNGSAGYGGGGIYCYYNSSPSLESVIISGNSADVGGGIYCYNNSSPSLENVTITSNFADESGGGICCESFSSPSLESVIITGNSAGSGGGIWCINSDPSLQNVTITNNVADSWGGGIDLENADPSLVDVTITGNSAVYGGGIHCMWSALSLVNVTITGNSAYLSGGGIYCYGSNPIFSSENRCNIYSNNVQNRGFGADIFAIECYTIIDVIVDTFTVMTPTDYYASPIDFFTFDILNGILDPLINSNLYVSVDGDDSNSGISPDEPLQTIRCALSKIYADSLNQNTIFLLPGIFSSDTNGEIFPIAWSNYVSLEGSGEEETILDADGVGGGVMRFNYVSDATIRNITVRNGLVWEGGGIYCYRSSPVLTNITITGNYAYKGGGIYSEYSNLSLVNVAITGNSAEWNGGGIYGSNNSSLSLEVASISDNSAYWNGGGIYCGEELCTLSLVNVTITGNSASDEGGGIYCEEGFNKILENVTISGNSASENGGGIYIKFFNSSLVNVAITGNSAEWNGGGIFFSQSSPSLVNVTITGNSASDEGGGIYCARSNPSLMNCILWNDSPEEICFYEDYDPNSITISYSDIQGGEAGIVTNNNGTVYWLEGNIDEDPLFVGTGGYPFSLLEESPCIDTGNPDPIYYDPEDPGNPGYALYPAMGTIINDMGAYGGPNAIGWPVVGLDDNIVIQTPEVFLHQNYPNPFNPETTISYQLRTDSKISLSIYNIKGQKVKTLVNEQLPAGEHSVIWNGRDSNDKRVSSGIYFYKLKTGDYQKVKKMVLVK